MYPSGVAESSTSFGWGKGGNVTSAGWPVTVCDPMWHVSSRSGLATLRIAIHLLLTYLFTPIVRRQQAISLLTVRQCDCYTNSRPGRHMAIGVQAWLASRRRRSRRQLSGGEAAARPTSRLTDSPMDASWDLPRPLPARSSCKCFNT